MRTWLIVLTWWLQVPIDRLRDGHLTTDPDCSQYRPPRRRSLLARASRDLECERCMVRRAFGFETRRPDVGADR